MAEIEIVDLGIRALMAAIFVWSGIDKLRHPSPLSAYLTAHGYRITPNWVRLCGFCEIAAAAMLVAGLAVWATCLALATFVVVSNVMVNDFWTKEGAEAAQARQRAIPSAGMVVGLLCMAAAAYYRAFA